MLFGQSSSDMENRKLIPIKFGLVSAGMTKKEVLDKFGEPDHVSISKENHYIWYYKSVFCEEFSKPINDIYIFFDDYKVIVPAEN
jgi:hypothetical protein